MSWREWLGRLMGHVVSPPPVGVAPTLNQQIARIIERGTPPDSMTDAAAWDRYWQIQVEDRTVAYVDLFCHDGALVDGMRQSGLHTILCVGSGLSQEPRALAAAGFDVTALDLSPWAMALAAEATPSPEFLSRLLGGRPLQDGGMLRCVTGDLRNPDMCPGPFDVIIERRTLQLFSELDRADAMEAMAARLGPRGLFFSHCHDNRTRPPAQPRHPTTEWFERSGWPRWTGGPVAVRTWASMVTTG